MDNSIITESDVEQKFVYGLITNPLPFGLGYSNQDFRTKGDIRKLTIDKGGKKKLYYPDYAVVANGLPVVIIEAKTPKEDLEEATRQARLYATEINSRYPSKINPCERIVVTDGIIIAAGYWDSDSYEVLMNVEDIDALDPNFESLQKFISKPYIFKRSEEFLAKIKDKTKYIKPTHMLGGKSVVNEEVGENSFGANVSVEYKYLFNPDSIKDRDEIINNAYVESKRKQAHVAPIDKIIRAAAPSHIIDARKIENTENPSEVINEIKNIDKITNEICLLVGSVGSGKSTFSDFLRVKALPDEVRNSTIWLNINLNKAPLSREKIYHWVVDNCIAKIKQLSPSVDFDEIGTLLNIYERQINKVKKGKASLYPVGSEKYADAIYEEITKLEDDPDITLDGMIKHFFTNQGKLLVIALDNCDKRVKEDQLLMFEVASWLKDTFKCMVFLPLRDTTYDQYKEVPPLDTVIKDLVFRIDPPLLERVIYKRLQFALREIDSQTSSFVYYLPNGMKVNCSRDEVGKYLRSIISSLFQDSLFRRIISGLAGRNIRKGLEIFLDFCKSGHITSDEIFKIRESKGEHKLPNHLIAKILMKGKRRYYSDENSYLKNLFASYQSDSLPDPFVRVDILQWLKSQYREYGPNRTKGFHKVETLVRSMQSLGHSSNRVMSELECLERAGCISAESSANNLDAEDLVCISPSGFVHIDLLKNINYLSSVSEDVLFRENQIADKIKENIIGQGRFKSNSRQTALSNSVILTNYLKSYFESHFIGAAKVLDDSVSENRFNINEIEDYVRKTANNDTVFSRYIELESEYPPGQQFEAQITKVENYGFFVEFGLNGKGVVHWKNFNGEDSILDRVEVADWVIVESLKYNPKHKKFDLKLIEA